MSESNEQRLMEIREKWSHKVDIHGTQVRDIQFLLALIEGLQADKELLHNSLISTPEGPLLCSHKVMVAYDKMLNQLEQEKKWKAEDPRMLREQIRVADVAFNGLNERHNAALAELERSQSTARDMRSTWEFGGRVLGKIVIPRAHQMQPGEIPFEFLERVFTQVDHLQAQLAECQAARVRLMDSRNDMEPI